MFQLPKAAGLVAVGVIIVVLEPSFVNSSGAHAATISGYGEIKVVAKGDHHQYCLGDKVKVAGLQFRDSSGNSIKQSVATGSQVSVQTMIDNGCDIPDYPATILLEVRGSDGITRYVAFQQITLEPNHQPRVGFSWVPDKPGDYRLRAFAITCPNCSGDLAPIMTHDISVY